MSTLIGKLVLTGAGEAGGGTAASRGQPPSGASYGAVDDGATVDDDGAVEAVDGAGVGDADGDDGPGVGVIADGDGLGVADVPGVGGLLVRDGVGEGAG